jgi:hypothetical protein
MELRLTPHAQRETRRRSIPVDLLQDVLTNPQQIVPAFGGRKAYQSVLDFGGGKTLLLRAIVEDWKEPAEVVTVYRTSRIDKYWRKES